MTVACLYTTVKNTSGVDNHFGFLPPHGVTLGADAEYSVAGDLVTRIANARDSERTMPSFEGCLDRTELVILHSPAVHLYDATTEEVKVLDLDNSTLGTIDPCWGRVSEDVVDDND